jgi:hypothetical protein
MYSLPKDFQSSSSETRSVLFRWLIRCRLVLVTKPSKVLVCCHQIQDKQECGRKLNPGTHQSLDRVFNGLRPSVYDVASVVIGLFQKVLHEASET